MGENVQNAPKEKKKKKKNEKCPNKFNVVWQEALHIEKKYFWLLLHCEAYAHSSRKVNEIIQSAQMTSHLKELEKVLVTSQIKKCVA